MQGDQPHFLLPFFYRALEAVVTLLLWGQLFAVELGNDAMDFEGESPGFSRELRTPAQLSPSLATSVLHCIKEDPDPLLA